MHYLVYAVGCAVPIAPCQYNGRWKIMGKSLYISDQCLRKLAEKPKWVPAACTEAYELRKDALLFHRFLLEWMSGSLTLYRGFPGCHYSWPDLVQGKLASEGDEDYPTFTMSDTGKGTTCWLPTADQAVAQAVAIQDVDAYTRALSMAEPIPISFVVKIFAGSNKNLPLCWMSAGEIMVKGPIYTGQYRFCRIGWLDNAQDTFRDWPKNFTNLFLPPVRPYKPGTRDPIDAWWQTCRAWMDAITPLDPVIQQSAARRAAAVAMARQVVAQNLANSALA